jgi:hypothetical protein
VGNMGIRCGSSSYPHVWHGPYLREQYSHPVHKEKGIIFHKNRHVRPYLSQKFIRYLSYRDLQGGRWGFEGPVGVTLDADGGTNCHDVVYPPQASQHLLRGMLPPPTSWPVNRISCRNDYFAGHPLVPLAVISGQGDGDPTAALGRVAEHHSHRAGIPTLEGPPAERGSR